MLSDNGSAGAVTIDPKKTYLHFAPAVRLGNSLAVLERFREKSWADIEPEGRRMWEQDHRRPWDEFKVVVRQAWEETRTQFTDDAERPAHAATFEAAFHRHFEAVYAKRGYNYNQCAVAYHFGYGLGADKGSKQKMWADIELDAKAYWQQQSYAYSWEEMKDAVQYAWQEVRQSQGAELQHDDSTKEKQE